MSLETKEKFEVAVVGRPLSQLLLDNPTLPCGLNLLDYIHVEKFRWICPGASRLTFEESWDLKLEEVLGSVWVGSRCLESGRDLWDCYREARRELVRLLCDESFRSDLAIEDVLLMRAMVEQGVIRGSLKLEPPERDPGVIKMIMDMDGSSQNLSSFVGDLCALCATLPADETTKTFLASFGAHEEPSGYLASAYMHRGLHEVREFLENRGAESYYVREEFLRRLRDHYIPEFERRLWEGFAEERNRLAEDGGLDDPVRGAAVMRKLGVPDWILKVIGDPCEALCCLIDTLKNSALANLSGLD